MPDGDAEVPSHLTAQVDLKLAGVRVQLTVTAPVGRVGPGALLPVLHALSEAIERDTCDQLAQKGKTVSCGPACGACCRQLVPVTRIEAAHLAELVAEMPEPRRSRLRGRFQAALRRLEEAGLLNTLRDFPPSSPREREALGLAYFQLGIACPFLEEESCSIHDQRPLSCREYLVTSPPQRCACPGDGGVEGVRLPIRLSGVLSRLANSPTPAARAWVPLPLVIETAESQTCEFENRSGVDWVEHLFRLLSSGEFPAAEKEPGLPIADHPSQSAPRLP